MKSIVRRVARFRDRFGETIDLESLSQPAPATINTVPTPTIIYNNSSNLNFMYGTGDIINNNHITNYFGSVDLSQGSVRLLMGCVSSSD